MPDVSVLLIPSGLLIRLCEVSVQGPLFPSNRSRKVVISRIGRIGVVDLHYVVQPRMISSRFRDILLKPIYIIKSPAEKLDCNYPIENILCMTPEAIKKISLFHIVRAITACAAV